MKKFALLLVTLATVFGMPAHAQTTGKAASAAKTTSNDSFQWGIAIVGIAVIGTVVGLTAASASSSPETFSQNTTSSVTQNSQGLY